MRQLPFVDSVSPFAVEAFVEMAIQLFRGGPLQREVQVEIDVGKISALDASVKVAGPLDVTVGNGILGSASSSTNKFRLGQDAGD